MRNLPDLSHVFWIGGAPDAGQSTVADLLAESHRLLAYHYHRSEDNHQRRLAIRYPDMALDASPDEAWVDATPETLAERAFTEYERRFPLVLDDLLNMPPRRRIVAEGRGLTPALLLPVLRHKSQAIWLSPTEVLIRETIAEGELPSFLSGVSDPERARQSLLARDLLLAERIKRQAARYDFELIEVEGSETAEDLMIKVAKHFRLMPD